MKLITERAAKHLKDLSPTNTRNQKRYLRLVPARAGFGLVMDKVRENDRVMDDRGVPILLLHPVLATALEDATLDYREFPEGSRLTVLR